MITDHATRFADGRLRAYALSHGKNLYRAEAGYTTEVLHAKSFQCHLDAKLERRRGERVVRVLVDVRVDKAFEAVQP